MQPKAKDGTPQCVFYGAGVGTNGFWNKIFGGGMGSGIDFNIKDAYRFLCLNYQSGDEIYLFGFSRGSYTVRSLAGLLYNSGLLRPEHLDKIDTKGSRIGAYQLYQSRKDIHKPGSQASIKFRHDYCVNVECCKGDDRGRVPITLLACWDTVGSLGIPPLGIFNIKAFFPQWLLNQFPGKYRFHDTRLNKTILNALHAVSIDERRRIFNVTLMSKDHDKSDKNGEVITITGTRQQLLQTWFPGDHGSIGGGEEHLQGLSDVTLAWMIKQIELLGLKLELDMGRSPYPPDPARFNYKTPFFTIDLFMISGLIWRKMAVDAIFELDIHESAKFRWRDLPEYRPETLSKRFEKDLQQWALENPLSHGNRDI